jgi:hypothetical protein
VNKRLYGFDSTLPGSLEPNVRQANYHILIRLDGSRMTPVPNARRDPFEATNQLAETGHGPKERIPSMNCSIKWKH